MVKKEQDDNDYWMRHLAWDLFSLGYVPGEAIAFYVSCTPSYLPPVPSGYDMGSGYY